MSHPAIAPIDRSPRQQIGLGLILILIALAVGFSWLSTTEDLRATGEATYGAQLFWIERKAEGQQPLPALGRLAIHLRLEQGSIASGSAEARQQLIDAGYSVTLLDDDTTDTVYYLANAQGQIDHARQTTARYGTVTRLSDQLLLVAVPRSEEQALLESAPAQGIALALIDPLPLPPWILAKENVAPAPRTRNAVDPLVADLLPLLTEEKLAHFIGKLSGETAVSLPGGDVTLDTRYTFAQRIRDAERYLYEYHKGLGLDPEYAEWIYGNYSGRNVVVDIPGSENPERIWVIGGHFDSNSEIPYTSAPGADDNASGVAATMIIADILKDHRFRDTVRFVYFSGEEQGQWGSIRYARDLSLAGAQIQGYIDLDMIGYDGNGDRMLELHTGSTETHPNSNALATAFIDVAERYGQGLSFERKTDSASRFSDHRSFWDYNYPAFLVIENFFTDNTPPDRNPWYHTSNDRLNAVDLDYVERIGRTALAAIAELAGIQNPSTEPTATPTVTTTPPTATPTTTPTATPTPSPTPLPTACKELVQNGGFENTETPAWTFSGAVPGQIVESPVHGGSHAARLGIPTDGNNIYAYSTAYQTVTLPEDADEVRLIYWEQPNGGDGRYDASEVRLLEPGSLVTIKTLTYETDSGDGEWRERTFDVTEFKGQDVVLYFSVYNNGGGATLWNYLDEVSLQACDSATPTPTPTSITSVVPTPTPTPHRSYLPHVEDRG